MLKKLMPDIMPELMNIEAKTHHFLKSNIRMLQNQKLTIGQEHLWLPLLCICSAKTIRNSYTKTLKLAEIFHLLSYATQLHCSLPDKNNNDKTDNLDMKYNILTGDLLYSRIYYNICKHGLQQYLMPLSTLISRLHESFILHDSYGWYYGYEIKAYALLGESACFLGAYSASEGHCRLQAIKEYGYHLGILQGAYHTGKNIAEYYSSWQYCWYNLEELMVSDKHYFEIILNELGAKWRIEKPFVTRECIVL